jgi:hypothetical protein
MGNAYPLPFERDPLPLMDNPPPVEIGTPSPFVAHIKVTPRDPPLEL